MKKMRQIGAIGLAALLLCGCGTGTKLPPTPQKEYQWEAPVVFDTESRIVPLEETLYEMLAQLPADQNLMLSPYSLEMLMTMVYHCTEGEARAELEQFLEIDGTEAEVYAANGAKRQALLREREGVELALADAFWLRSPEECYAEELQAALREYYDCEIFAVEEFGEAEVAQINDWAKEKTKGLIPKVLDQLSSDTRMVLTDALYFNGTWQTLFQPRDSFQGNFWSGEEATLVNYMSMNGGAFVGANVDGVQAIELPYGDAGDVFMDVFIENGRDGLDYAALFGNNGARLKQILAELDASEPAFYDYIQLPKWKETYNLNGLEKTFAKSGLTKIFEPGNLARIYEETFIEQIFQKTAIEVTEHGTEAAAVSVGIGTDNAAAPKPKQAFIVDHAFAYVIRDLGTDEILFAGVVNQLDHE